MRDPKHLPAHKICFGMDRATDELSLKSFISRFADDKLLEVLIPKLTESEIENILDCLSSSMRPHLSEKQYHKLFLSD